MSRDSSNNQLKIPGARWVHDNEADKCMNEKCADRKSFSILHRRHHCRWCGKVFCDDCAPVRATTSGLRKCRSCFMPMCFMPVRFPTFVKRASSPTSPKKDGSSSSPANNNNNNNNSLAAAAAAAGGQPNSPQGAGSEFEIENRNLRGVHGFYVLGRFSGGVIDNIMSFLEFSSLNALLQMSKKAQSHFHVRGMRYEACITDKYPTYWTQARIGDGGGGVVFKVRDPNVPADKEDKFVALKVVKKSAQYGFAVWKRLRTEIDLQYKIDHPNIAKLLDVFQTPDEVVLVIEAGDGGSLRKVFEVLRSNHQQISWFTAHCLNQCASALATLRSLNIAHRDIKCDNVVLSDDFSRVMMIDFGLAEHVTSDRQMFTPCGTVGFASPENIAAVAERRAKFAAGIEVMHKADMFSMGVVAYMMLSSTKPFKGSRFPEMHREVQQGLRCEGRGWGHVSSAAKMLVERMLRGDAAARASAEDVMQDPWVLEGCKRFRDVIARRRDDLQKQRAQLDDEWDMPTLSKVKQPGSPSSPSGASGSGADGLPEEEVSNSCWAVDGQVVEMGGQLRDFRSCA